MKKYEKFWEWFAARREHLKNSPPEQAAGLIADRLAIVDSRLAVEVADDDETRELLLTAHRNRDAFQVIRDIVAEAPKSEGWAFHALKPAMGFEFTIDGENGIIDPKTMVFEPLRNDKRPDQLGIRIFVTDEDLGTKGLEDLIWLVVETGVGEEAASKIEYLDVAPISSATDSMIPLPRLGEFLDWSSRPKR